MELELGLGLSCCNINVNSSFDLNNINGFDHQNGSSRSTTDDHFRNKNKKRSFDDTLVDNSPVVVPKTLHLLAWNSKTTAAAAAATAEESTNYYDDHVDDASSISTNKNEGGDQGNVVIGWPPVKSWRKKLCHQKPGGGGGGGSGGMKSIYVKVKMEGVGIARKVDLSQHGSYQALIRTLIAMFGYENVKLTYQDEEGDWLLAGDVPWGIFIHTVQRLKLIKSGKE